MIRPPGGEPLVAVKRWPDCGGEGGHSMSIHPLQWEVGLHKRFSERGGGGGGGEYHGISQASLILLPPKSDM